jgi:PAS domain S-box-containing protein
MIEKWVVMIANFMLINTLITLLVAVMLDSLKNALTREENATIELRKKHEELMAIFTVSPDPVLVYDSLDHVQYLNYAFTDTFGWNLNEVKGRKIPFIPKDQQRISSDVYLKGKVKDTAIRFETKRLTKDGKLLDVSFSAAPIKGNMGDTVRIVANIKDIGCGSFATCLTIVFSSHNISYFPSVLLDYFKMISSGRRLWKLCWRNFSVLIMSLMIPFVFTGFMEVPVLVKIATAP